MSSQGRNYHIEQMENEDKKERMIDGVKSANKMQDRAIFGKPKVGKTLAKIYGTIVLVFVLVIAVLLIFDVFPNPEVDEHYMISFETNGGTAIESYEYNETIAISLPNQPVREGYLFVGWYLDADFATIVTPTFLRSIDDHGDLKFYARWVPDNLEIILTFDTNGGSLISAQTLLVATDLSSFIPTKANLYFAGWFLEPTFNTLTTKVPYENGTLYAMWSPIEMAIIGQSNYYYTFPVGATDYRTETLIGGFELAKTETTYQLWYEVRLWAEQHGYTFSNLGKEGSDGVIGALPTANSNKPVTNVNYLDVIVWLNALSELYELEPVYTLLEHQVIKDSGIDLNDIYLLVNTENNGYRLPNYLEWEMAARWNNDTVENTYSMLVSDRYWNKANTVSGAKDSTIVGFVSSAWYTYNSSGEAHAVATRNANDLGLYDMNGNVSEWVDYTSYSDSNSKIIRGGSYLDSSHDVLISSYDSTLYTTVLDNIGFRIAIGNIQ